MKCWKLLRGWKSFVISRKVQVKFFLKNSLVTLKNICVGFKNMQSVLNASLFRRTSSLTKTRS